jgi:hypothetical protein
VVWLWLTAFNQVYSEKQKRKAEKKDLKTCSLVRKVSVKLELKKAYFSEDISTIEKKPSTLYQDNRKQALMARPQPSQAPRDERVNSLKRLSLEKRVPLEHPAHIGPPKNLLPLDSFRHA